MEHGTFIYMLQATRVEKSPARAELSIREEIFSIRERTLDTLGEKKSPARAELFYSRKRFFYSRKNFRHPR